MFADLQSPSVNLPEPAVDQSPGDGKFSDLMNKKLNQSDDLPVNAEYPQVADIKELKEIPDDVLRLHGDLVTGTEVPAAWLEYLAGQEIAATTGEVITPSVGRIARSDIESLVEETAGIMPGTVNPAIGDQLPVAGKPLPPAVDSQIESLASVATVPAPVLQKDLMRQANSLDQTQAADVDSNELKATDLTNISTNTGTLKNSFANSLNPDVPAESAKQSKSGELQAIITDLAGNIRTQNPSVAMAHGVTQSTSPLPAQLDVLAVPNTRDTAAWSNGIGERVHYMINQKLNSATIRLDPPMLGRLDVHIRVSDDITHVTINTQHAHTRDLIDNASFKLRDFLQDSGYENVNVDVSHQQESQQQTSEQAGDGSGDVSEEGLSAQVGTMSGHPGDQYFSSDSVVDYFA